MTVKISPDFCEDQQEIILKLYDSSLTNNPGMEVEMVRFCEGMKRIYFQRSTKNNGYKE